MLFFGVSFFATALLHSAQAQDDVQTRSVQGKERAAESDLVINQIDTSLFPKVTIFATVLKDSVPQQGLGASDFRVREDEVDQAPLTVAPKLSPLSVVVTLDVSGSMKGALAQAQQAAIDFIGALEPNDAVAALSFARQVTVLCPFSGGREQAKQSLKNTNARGDTALYDALYSSVEVIKERPGRKAVILLSDGVDDDGYGEQLSKHAVSDVLALAREVNVPIYAIGLGAEIDEKVLTQVSKESGARYYAAAQASDLAGLYDSIGKELSGQYNINYTSNLPGDGATHKVRLSYGNLANVKEYVAPNLETAAAQPQVIKSEAAPPQEQSQSLSFGFGTLLVKGLKNQTVKVHRDGKELGYFSDYRAQLKLPSGDYEISFSDFRTHFTVPAGAETDLPLATVKVPNLVNQTIKVFRDGMEAGYFSEYRQQLKLPPGDYDFAYGDFRTRLPLQSGVEMDLPLGTVKLPGLNNQTVKVFRDGKEAGYFSEYRQQIKLPPGAYSVKLGQFGDQGITVQEGQTLNLSM